MKWNKGLIIGKFLPPHKGHSYLIEQGLKNCQELTVVVCHKDEQPIPGAIRANWLKELHPTAKVMVIKDINQDTNSKAWAKYTKQFLGYTPDVVFTSEDYGHDYCKYLGCEHVQVDKARITVPISGTKVRANPMKEWEYIAPCVRAHYAKRVCIVGAESTGTTTLAKALAEHYKTNWVPEGGRFYSEGKLPTGGYNWISSEFTSIAQIQNTMEDSLAKTCNKILICDTNSWVTNVWHERYLGKPSSEINALTKNRKYDLYIITADDIPFVQDGTRDGEHIRHNMHLQFINKLEAEKVKVIIVTGSHEKRLQKAIKHCDLLLK